MKTLDRFRQVLTLKRYSPRTILSSTNAVKTALREMRLTSADELTSASFERYMLKKVESGISASWQRMIVASVALYAELVVGRTLKVDHLYPSRHESKLPNVLSKQDVKAIFDATSNIKHKALLMTLYSGGLRLNEVVHLRLQDIDSKRMVITIRAARSRRQTKSLHTYTTSLLRNPPSRIGNRHPFHSGIPGSPIHQDDRDLYPRDHGDEIEDPFAAGFDVNRSLPTPARLSAGRFKPPTPSSSTR